MNQPEDKPSPKQFQICCSSFDMQKKTLFRELINKLSGTHNDDLNLETNVLIAKTVISPKYTAASIINIPVVTEKWLFESFQAGHFLPFSDFLLPCFSGLHIGVLGFNEQENEELKTLIEEQDGNCYWNHHKIIDEKICHVIILKQKQAKFYESCIETLEIPVISIDWLKQCLLQKHCLNTTRYLISASKRLAQEMRICDENIVNKVLSEYDCSDDTFNYLQRCIITFHKIGEKTEKVQRKLIAAGGGFFLKEFLPSATHVVTEFYSEEAQSEFKKYSNTKIVSPAWLSDCFIYRRRLPEEDYHVRVTASMPVLDERSKTMGRMNSDTRMSFDSSIAFNALSRHNSYGIGSQPKTMLRRASSVYGIEQVVHNLPSGFPQKEGQAAATTTSGNPKSVQKIKSPVQVRGKSRKSQSKMLSNILKDCNFVLDSSLNDLTDKYYQKVVENGGKIIPGLNEFEEIYWVMADCPDSKIKAQKHSKKQNVKIISWRWIDSSLSKKRQINNIIEDSLLQYLPLPHFTPFEEFKNKTIFAAGFEPRRKGILKEILQILGATIVYDPKKLDLLIVCKKDSKKFSEVSLNYRHVPIVQEAWVFMCVEAGKFLETSQFAVV